jgi:hypothetical protein
MLVTTMLPRCRAVFTRDKWPSCRFPMVGTRTIPLRRPRAARNSAMVRIICTLILRQKP